MRWWDWLMGEDMRSNDAVQSPRHAVHTVPLSNDAVSYQGEVARAVREINDAVDAANRTVHVVDAVAEPPTEMVGQIGRHMAFQAVERVKIFSIGLRTVEVHTENCGDAVARASSVGARVELASMEELEDGGFLTYDHVCRRSGYGA